MSCDGDFHEDRAVGIGSGLNHICKAVLVPGCTPNIIYKTLNQTIGGPRATGIQVKYLYMEGSAEDVQQSGDGRCRCDARGLV